MKFKYDWSPVQQDILKTLKKHFSQPLYIPCRASEIVNLCYKLSANGEPSFSAVWEVCREMASYPGKFYVGAETFCQMEFLFGLIAMFQTDYSNPYGQFEHFQYSFLDPAADICVSSPALEHLSERLQDPALRTAVEAGDIPRVIYLLDSCARPGKKLKNITHMLLNRRNYTGVIQLQEYRGALDEFSSDILRPHWLFNVSRNCGDSAFCRYYYSVCDHKKVWINMHKYGLNFGIADALEAGVSPDRYIFHSYYCRFTLRQYLLFLLELLDELKQMIHDPKSDFKSFQLIQDINAAEFFLNSSQESVQSLPV